MVLIGEIAEDIVHNAALKASRIPVQTCVLLLAQRKRKEFSGENFNMKCLPAQILRFGKTRDAKAKGFAKQRR